MHLWPVFPQSPKPNPNASGFKGFFKNVETMVNRATAKINEVDEVSNCTNYEDDYDEQVWATKDGHP